MGIQHLILLLIQQTILQMIQRTIPHSIPQMILLRTQPLTRRGTPLQTQPVILVQNLRMLQLQNDVYHGVQTVDSPGLQNALLMNAGVAMIALPVQPELVGHGVQPVDSPGLQNALLMTVGVAMIALLVQPELVGLGVQPVDSPGPQNALLMTAGVAMIALLVQPELVYHGVQPVDSRGLQNALLMNAGVAEIALLVRLGVPRVVSHGQRSAVLMIVSVVNPVENHRANYCYANSHQRVWRCALFCDNAFLV